MGKLKSTVSVISSEDENAPLCDLKVLYYQAQNCFFSARNALVTFAEHRKRKLTV